jgi:hypothetical protein
MRALISYLKRSSHLALMSAVLGAGAIALGGCMDQRDGAIPPAAMLRAQGDGNMVSFTTNSHGFAYVEDFTDLKLIWSGEVHADEMIAVDAEHDVVTVGGRTVLDKGVHPDHKYKIYVDTTAGRN